MKRWTKKEVNELKKLFNKGSTDEEIADKLNRSLHSIKNKRRIVGLYECKGRVKEIPPEEIELLKKLTRERVPIKEQAEILNYSINHLTRVRAKLNLKQRNWTKEDIKKLREFHKQKIPVKEQADYFKRAFHVVSMKRHKLGLSYKSRRWTDEDIENLRKFSKMNLSNEAIGLKLKRTPAAVKTQKTKQGLN